jgi:hypothetical protein
VWDWILIIALFLSEGAKVALARRTTSIYYVGKKSGIGRMRRRYLRGT